MGSVVTFSKSPRFLELPCSWLRLICRSTSPSDSRLNSGPPLPDKHSLSAFSTTGKFKAEILWTRLRSLAKSSWRRGSARASRRASPLSITSSTSSERTTTTMTTTVAADRYLARGCSAYRLLRVVCEVSIFNVGFRGFFFTIFNGSHESRALKKKKNYTPPQKKKKKKKKKKKQNPPLGKKKKKKKKKKK